MGDLIAQRDLRNDISTILRRVAEGESFTVTVRGKPVAELVPLRSPRRFVPRHRVVEILRDNAADPGLLEELREMDIDEPHLPGPDPQ